MQLGTCASDSKEPDAQQAYDFSLTAIPAALAGANIIYGIGALESVLTFDYAAMITGAEQVQRIIRLLEGIIINDKRLAVDLIHEVGPTGDFLTHDHTQRYMYHFSRSSLFDRRTRDDWEAYTGSKSLNERAYEKAADIIANHKPMPLPPGAAEMIRQTIEEFEAQC